MIKMVNLFFALSILTITSSCNSQDLDSLFNKKGSLEEFKIRIVDHCGRPKFNTFEIHDTLKIKRLINELKKIKKFEDHSPAILQPPITNNFGFFEIFIITNNNVKIPFEIVYSVYDGVIININGSYYKNDNLEILIREYVEDNLH